jgi:hypothetical protein
MRAWFALFAILLPVAAFAQTNGAQTSGVQTGGIEVQQAWARATPGTLKTGAAYFTVDNTGGASDRLMSVATTVAESASLHEEKMDGGMMTMRPLGPVTIEPGKSLTLKPGGDHLMLEGLKKPLKEGDHFSLTLTFEKAGARQVDVAVGKAAAMGPPGAPAMSGMDMGAMGHMDMSH